jgi:hypothetical protein
MAKRINKEEKSNKSAVNKQKEEKAMKKNAKEVKGAKSESKKNPAVTKKVMKREETKSVFNLDPIRKIFNKILQMNKGLTLVENKHGAVQIKRSGDLLFSARGDGMIVTHPMFEGKGKDKKRVWNVKGGKWDHLSRVPFDKVTQQMLQARVDDPKSVKEWHDSIYSGKARENSGLVAKAEAARQRIEKIKNEAEKKKGTLKREKKAALSAKVDLKKRSKKPALSKVKKTAIQRVAAKA